MITKKVTKEIYKKYKKPPKQLDQLDIPALFDEALAEHEVYIDDENIIIGSLPASSPFHAIPLRRVHAILTFETATAIVLHSSIIFLSRKGKGISVHLKETPTSMWQKLKWWFTNR
ncbi:MAG: hypothetical protein NC117_08675 [Pseudoflavonifractor sp.]|nr:hypothetical protein [Pseudoflavonifractor sp.]